MLLSGQQSGPIRIKLPDSICRTEVDISQVVNGRAVPSTHFFGRIAIGDSRRE